MQAISFKLGHIFVPLLLAAVGFAAIYSAANYCLVVATGWLPLDREVANAWLPLLLGLGLTAAIIAPRIDTLKPGKKRDVFFYYQIIAAAVIIVPTILSQYYLASATGKLIHVEKAEMIATAPKVAYYTAASTCIDRSRPVVTERTEYSGRHNETLEFKLYVLAPVCAQSGQRVWIASAFHDSIASNASKEERAARYQAFLQQTQAQFDAMDFSQVQYFEALGRTGDRRIYEKALTQHGVTQPGAPIILIPHQDGFDERSGQTGEWSIYSFGIGAGIFLLMILFRPLDKEKVEQARLPRSARKPDKDSVWQFFFPRLDDYGLPLLLDLNLGVFIAMVLCGLGVFTFQTDDLIVWGGLYGPAVHGLGAYRMVTSQFVHGGLIHIMSNVYGLFFAGVLLSPVFRKWGLIVSYLVCGLAGGGASLFTHPATVTIGASGAIMGLFGLLLTLALLGEKRVKGARTMILTNCVIFAGLTLAQGALMPGIDNWAHLAGLAAGMAVGLPVFAFSWGLPVEPHSEATALISGAPGGLVAGTSTSD